MAKTRVCALGMESSSGFRNVCEIESKRSGELIGCGDQLETGINMTPKFLALGGGALTRGGAGFRQG